ncbi:fibronectin type-III domain-containing transmembrane protein C1orf233 homolog [Stegastes partitus]|uniref:Fibronectin type-III domain-containing transmembrane protein C1orf233 homolog n=1 Tax=Stegastes partitus TaxID=144197 RepID=A0A9Y4N112_9TELE|nr:PREDICTED: fibronectin type-III domain-containing transmembrane protein C1orf233 homolog [Stegastes partitus]
MRLRSGAASEEAGRDNVAPNWLRQNNISSSYGNHSHQSRPKRKEAPGHGSSFNTSRGNNTSVMSERSGRAPSWSPEEDGPSPVCAYRVIEGGIGGQLCFRRTLFGYKCHVADCRTAVSVGSLVANILINGSVLLQWTHEGQSTVPDDGTTKESAAARTRSDDPGTNSTNEEPLRSNTVFGGRRHRRGGYELSCWWNGSYTQFECAGVHLGSGCRDFLLAELHENIPYRICLRSLGRSEPAKRAEQRRDCVEFTLPPSGMQDIVIAMTTVGGAICVMLVIICLLVAYITENIMSPTTQHAYSYRTHSRH